MDHLPIVTIQLDLRRYSLLADEDAHTDGECLPYISSLDVGRTNSTFGAGNFLGGAVSNLAVLYYRSPEDAATYVISNRFGMSRGLTPPSPLR